MVALFLEKGLYVVGICKQNTVPNVVLNRAFSGGC